jgi:pyruvate/2-oxoglutarate dehydrogenase complex dihydrolipoamide dehydrogenase (E3) component
VDYRNVPWTTFSDPELAHSGITEKEARERYGDKIRIYRFPYSDVDRARTDLAEFGMSKFICSRKGKLLGIHILGNHAADLLHEAQLLKVLGKPLSKAQSMIHVYPTYGDVVKRPAGRLYADLLRDNFFIKLIQGLRGKKKQSINKK